MEPLVMPEMDFGQKKTDPISIVKKYLTNKHGETEGLKILKDLCAGDVIEMADKIKNGQQVILTTEAGKQEPLVMPELSWD